MKIWSTRLSYHGGALQRGRTYRYVQIGSELFKILSCLVLHTLTKAPTGAGRHSVAWTTKPSSACLYRPSTLYETASLMPLWCHTHSMVLGRTSSPGIQYLCHPFSWHCSTKSNYMQCLARCHMPSGDNVTGIACCHRKTASRCCRNAKLKPRHLWKINIKSKPRCLF